MNGLEKEVVCRRPGDSDPGSRFCALPKSARDNSPWVGYGSKTKLRLRSGMQCLPPNRHKPHPPPPPMSIFAPKPDSFFVEVTLSQMTILHVDLSNAIACSAPLW